MIGLPMEAGDAILFTENLRHGGFPNVLDQTRKTIHVCFGPIWAPSQSPAHWNGFVHVTEAAWAIQRGPAHPAAVRLRTMLSGGKPSGVAAGTAQRSTPAQRGCRLAEKGDRAGSRSRLRAAGDDLHQDYRRRPAAAPSDSRHVQVALMAITRHLAELILTEHRFRKITGRVLMLGRQTVFMKPEEAMALVRRVGLEVRPAARIGICTMPHGKKNGYIADASFFSLFTDAVVEACDVTDYEGAEHVFDLSREPPAGLLGAFDFIYNGSVLDNVFDPAACLRNTTRMLKPDGSIFHYEGVVHWGAAYLKMSPDWFFDYYAVNGFG
jgi:hypothetical protein